MSTEHAPEGAGANSVDVHEQKSTTIIVNATPHEVAGKTITFEEVVNLAFNNAPPSGPYVLITVTYTRGEQDREGSLLPGDSVKLKNMMVFDVTSTDRS